MQELCYISIHWGWTPHSLDLCIWGSWHKIVPVVGGTSYLHWPLLTSTFGHLCKPELFLLSWLWSQSKNNLQPQLIKSAVSLGWHPEWEMMLSVWNHPLLFFCLVCCYVRNKALGLVHACPAVSPAAFCLLAWFLKQGPVTQSGFKCSMQPRTSFSSHSPFLPLPSVSITDT